MNLFNQDIHIDKEIDIKTTILEILKSDRDFFEIKVDGEFESHFKLKGGRFDREYLPISTIDIVVQYKKDFKNFFSKLLKSEVKDDILYYDIKRGSFGIDIEAILTSIIQKAINNMTGKELAIVLVVGIVGWFSKEAWRIYLTKINEKLSDKNNAEIAKDSLSLAKKAINTLLYDKHLQLYKNRPVYKALDMLEDDEILEYGSIKDFANYTQKDKKEFEYDEDEELIRYQDISDEFIVKSVSNKNKHIKVELLSDRYKTFKAISKLSDNSPLYHSLDKGEKIGLKLKVGFDEDDVIKEADILDVIKSSA